MTSIYVAKVNKTADIFHDVRPANDLSPRARPRVPLCPVRAARSTWRWRDLRRTCRSWMSLASRLLDRMSIRRRFSASLSSSQHWRAISSESTAASAAPATAPAPAAVALALSSRLPWGRPPARRCCCCCWRLRRAVPSLSRRKASARTTLTSTMSAEAMLRCSRGENNRSRNGRCNG